MTSIAFFNNKGGVGKTSLVYHLAWMYADLGLKVLAADLDPQANLTTMFIKEDDFESLWAKDAPKTVMSPIRPLLEGEGGIDDPVYETIGDITLLPGDMELSSFEDELSRQWTECLAGKKRAFRVIAAFHEVISRAAAAREVDIALIDVGPNLGAINRAALIAADHVVVPLAPDLFSLKGIENLGPTVARWREEWKQSLAKQPGGLDLPSGDMNPAGYVVMQHAMRLDRPVQAYGKWMDRIPNTYRVRVLGNPERPGLKTDSDPYCLARLKHFRSLMPLAQEARKPMFKLKPADGAIGGHATAVESCRKEFHALAAKLAERTGIPLP